MEASCASTIYPVISRYQTLTYMILQVCEMMKMCNNIITSNTQLYLNRPGKLFKGIFEQGSY